MTNATPAAPSAIPIATMTGSDSRSDQSVGCGRGSVNHFTWGATLVSIRFVGRGSAILRIVAPAARS